MLRGLDLNQRPLGYEPSELPKPAPPRMYKRLPLIEQRLFLFP